jgi:AcrR family transcriptional regulator
MYTAPVTLTHDPAICDQPPDKHARQNKGLERDASGEVLSNRSHPALEHDPAICDQPPDRHSRQNKGLERDASGEAQSDRSRPALARKKPRGTGASRRDEILAAAKRLFLTDGFEHVTIRKIAAAVGVTSGALYLYFPDKNAITRAIAEATFEALLARLEEARAHIDGNPLERLRAGMQAYVAFGRAHPDEYRLTFLSKMLTESSPGRCGQKSDIEAADRSFDVLLGETTKLIEVGLFRPMDPMTAAETLWACAHGVTSVLLDHAEHIGSDADFLAETVIDVTLRGLSRS